MAVKTVFTSAGTKLRLSNASFLQSGGEGEVHTTSLIGPGGEALVAKLYHPHIWTPTQGQKLRAFPKVFPTGLIGPTELLFADAKAGEPIGFLMRSLVGCYPIYQFMEMDFSSQFTFAQVCRVVANGAALVRELLGHHLQIGDVNDLGFLVHPQTLAVHLIDADSVQFGQFRCTAYTQEFLDPHVRWDNQRPLYVLGNDWYAWAAIAFQTLFRIRPWDGTHPRLKPSERLQQGITVLHPEVVYPQLLVRPFGIVPDAILNYFRRIFTTTSRDPFPEAEFSRLVFTICTSCHKEHAHPTTCPYCKKQMVGRKAAATPVATQAPVMIAGSSGTRTIFRGQVLFATCQEGQLRYLVFDPARQVLLREDGKVVQSGFTPTPATTYSIFGRNTVVAKPNDQGTANVQVLGPPRPFLAADITTHLFWERKQPMVGSSADHLFTLSPGVLVANYSQPISYGAATHNTWLAVSGDGQGIALSHVYPLTKVFLFTAGGQKEVRLPEYFAGQPLALHASFSDTHVLLAWRERVGAFTQHVLWLIRKSDGAVEAMLREDSNPRANIAHLVSTAVFRDKVLAATPEGLAIFRPEQGRLVKTKILPDTLAHAAPGCRLLVDLQGQIFVITPNGIEQVHVAGSASPRV